MDIPVFSKTIQHKDILIWYVLRNNGRKILEVFVFHNYTLVSVRGENFVCKAKTLQFHSGWTCCRQLSLSFHDCTCYLLKTKDATKPHNVTWASAKGDTL